MPEYVETYRSAPIYRYAPGEVVPNEAYYTPYVTGYWNTLQGARNKIDELRETIPEPAPTGLPYILTLEVEPTQGIEIGTSLQYRVVLNKFGEAFSFLDAPRVFARVPGGAWKWINTIPNLTDTGEWTRPHIVTDQWWEPPVMELVALSPNDVTPSGPELMSAISGVVSIGEATVPSPPPPEPYECPPTPPETLIVYNRGPPPGGDDRSAELIADQRGGVLLPLGVATEGLVYCNYTILIGTPDENPFVASELPEISYDPAEGLIRLGPEGLGYAEPSIIYTKTRDNGRWITLIAGHTEELTYQKAQEYVAGVQPLPPPDGEWPPTPTADPIVGSVCGLNIYQSLEYGTYYVIYLSTIHGDFTDIEALKDYVHGVLTPPGCAEVPPDIPGLPTPGPSTTDDGLFLGGILGQFRNTGDLAKDPQAAAKFRDAISGFIEQIGLTPSAIEAVKESPMNREKAAQLATAISIGAQTGLGLLYSIGLIAEISSLGQIDTVVDLIDNMVTNTGIDEVLRPLFGAPFYSAIIRPTRQYWQSQFTPEIPGQQDLITFVVREVISPELFKYWMKFHGFDSEWSDAYWEAHWRLPSIGDVIDAYHRKLITAEERDKYIVWHDYKPEPRPGIAKSDLEIYAGLQKRMIGRVDVRRAYEVGLLNFEQMVALYELLGYEEDSELMANVQAHAATVGERNAVARASGRAFRERIISEEDYLNVLQELHYSPIIASYWVRRYQWERITRPLSEEELRDELEDLGFEYVPPEEEPSTES